MDNRDCALCIYYRPFKAGCVLRMRGGPCYRYRKYIGRRTYDDRVFDEEVSRWQGWSDYDREHYLELSKRGKDKF